MNCFWNGLLLHFQLFFENISKIEQLSRQRDELHCTCGMPETFDDMVKCDLCEKWFHLSCEGIISIPAVDEQWLCEFCTV